MGQVVRIHPNAVASNQSGFKGEKIPLGSCGFKYFMGVNANAVKDQGQLIYKGDVDISL